jgi:protease IV
VQIVPGRGSRLLLELDLTVAPVIADPDDPLARFRARGRHQLGPTLRALHEAADDRRVAGLIVKVGGRLPWAVAQELRLGVREFVQAGKPAVSWAESFAEGHDMAAYMLAAACGEVWLQPGGGLGLLGVGVETTFVRGLLDKIGVEPQVEQRWEYKNAADRLLRTEFTEEHRKALDRLAQSVFDDAIAAIAADRELEVDRVRELVETGPRIAAEAREAGLVDQIGYRDEVYEAMRSRLGADVTLLFADRWRPRRRASKIVRRRRAGYVALVPVRGPIVSGRSRHGPVGRQAGSGTVAGVLRAAGRDNNARAVLLWVDSPGGSAVASEVIWREVKRLRDADRPVIVSMGDVAASGGYYIACPADVIVALPATLTGSIGVFGGKLVARELLDRLGLTTGSVEHGGRSLMYSSRRGFSEGERERLAAGIDAVYDDFVSKVADGRGRPVTEIEAIARGRVWTGSDALGIGLVDVLGGVRDAARLARERADLPDDAPVRHPVHVPPLQRLGRAKNSEDPRAQIAAGLPGLTDLAVEFGLPAAGVLRMPPITLS